MDNWNRGARGALVIAGVMTLLAASAGAQRSSPRAGSAPPPPPRAPRIGTAGQASDANERRDPRWRNAPSYDEPRVRRSPYNRGSTVIYVPVPAGSSYGGYGYVQDGEYVGPSYGGVYDANGRALSSSLEPTTSGGGYGYTPDLSGSPYVVTNEGMMVVDLESGDRRAFPSCAGQKASRDPQGRPRTIFYQPTDYWMVLRPGQRGRVQGDPPGGAVACYTVDSVGRVVLRY